LEALFHGGIGRVVFYFMNCFRSLFELSLGKRGREREFRADRIAAEITSPRDLAGALLRTTAYSKFRNGIQQKLFEQERVLESTNIAGQIAEGFSASAGRFAAEHDIGELKSSHPFDSHPPLADRLEAVGVPLSPATAESLLAAPGDGGWYPMIDKAGEIERQQWDGFEAKFRSKKLSTPSTATGAAIKALRPTRLKSVARKLRPVRRQRKFTMSYTRSTSAAAMGVTIGHGTILFIT